MGAAASIAHESTDPDDPTERLHGYGVMGLPFETGDYLALRVMVATSIGPAYRAVWHRNPGGEWTIYTTAPPELSCPRYYGAMAASVRVPRIDLEWTSDWDLEIVLPTRLRWRIGLSATAATRLMSGIGSALPASAWNSDAVLAPMGPMAAAALGSGRVRLHGATPNGQHFKAAPLRVWRVADSSAVLGRVDLGMPLALAEQTHLVDLWLPQRGIFYAAHFRYTPPAAVPEAVERIPADRAG